jgi:hypothetical protein
MIGERNQQTKRDECRHADLLFLPATITLKSITPPIKLNDRRKIEAASVEPSSPVKRTQNHHIEKYGFSYHVRMGATKNGSHTQGIFIDSNHNQQRCLLGVHPVDNLRQHSTGTTIVGVQPLYPSVFPHSLSYQQLLASTSIFSTRCLMQQ